MRCAKLVIGLGLLASGCYSYGYYRRPYYYGGGYYAGSVAYAQPVPQQNVAVEGQGTVQQQGTVQGQVTQQQVGSPPPPQVVGEGIAGSDGTRGWRVVSQSPGQDFQRMVQGITRANCQAEANAQGELRAMCAGNIHIIIRFDQQNVYKLCAPGTDPAVCTQIWSAVGN